MYNFKLENNNKKHYINGDYNKGHSFEFINLRDNFLIKDKILIILLFQLIELDFNITLLKDKYKKINIKLN